MQTAIYPIILLSLLLCGCKKADLKGILNLNRNEISVIGHGGMGVASTYPMDTYESLTAAITAGAHGVEIDVQMSSDSVLVAFHNTDMNSNTSCTGKINEHSWEALKECEYVKEIFGVYRILSLPEMVEFWQDEEPRIIVFDCKLIYNSNFNEFLETYANQLIKLVESISFGGDVLIESQNIAFLQLIQGLKPTYKLFFYPQSFEEGLSTVTANGLYGITIASSKITKEQIAEAHDNGLRVAIWNVNSRGDNVDAINKSPDYIQTDKLKGLLRLLK
jgi:glycerophosphoryl diester phosphodiesterase